MFAPASTLVSSSAAAAVIQFRYTTAIAHEPGVVRRDPSDVIRVGGQYFVWYTKVVKALQRDYPSGYNGSIWYAVSSDGHAWQEKGLCLEPGADDAWDGHGVFTPNILAYGRKFYLYYTAVPEPFDVPWTAGKTPTAIGVAVSGSPDGPWVKYAGNPILEPALAKPQDFDSLRVDDAALIVRQGGIWMYYKGRSQAHGSAGPGKTRMGVAIAEKPTGPFVRQRANPLHPGHEVLVWPQGEGVWSMATAAGPRQLYYASDGLQFSARHRLIEAPQAPGIFRPDQSAETPEAAAPQWGISQAGKQGDVYLLRFDFGGPVSE